ncbi:hypothetical protein [Bradyrhizobium sp. F1.13.3]|uniref:hypothetical protein n=1 Tax=Bradyrhizobium sp. F1.13.3 TaxID=3156351 RepID=UPI0033966758
MAALPGYKPVEGNRGYYFDSPTGRCAFLGTMPGDECHIHERWGMINISKCWDEIEREGGAPQITAIDDRLKQNIASYEFDQSLVDAMTVSRRDEPVLFILADDGVHLIDGTHRLRRRIQDGRRDVRCFLLAPTVFREARVILIRQQSEGSWQQEIGLNEEDLDREIRAAEDNLQSYVRPVQR